MIGKKSHAKWICVGVLGGLLEFGFVYLVAFSGPDAASLENTSPDRKRIVSARGAGPAAKTADASAGSAAAAQAAKSQLVVAPAAGTAVTPVAHAPAPTALSGPAPVRDRKAEAANKAELDRLARERRALERKAVRDRKAAEEAKAAEERKAAAERKAAEQAKAAEERKAAAERKAHAEAEERKAAAERKAQASAPLGAAATEVASRAAVAPLSAPPPDPIQQLAQALALPVVPVQAPPPPVDLASLPIEEMIRKVFGPQGDKAVEVARCESTLRTHARSGQFLGLFQMGENERADYGHGPDALAQVKAAYALFLDRGWQPWTCA
ncbi:MAG TPA: hypothetical protein VHJ78_12650 [Actinomycetota bacterium]|nr:hypothetical protein [Actinomycetota bacterium]